MTRRRWIIAGGVVAVVAVAAAIAFVFLGSTDTVTAGAVTVEAPSSWSVQNNGDRGLVVAMDESDLLRRESNGPRLTAKPVETELPDLAEAIKSDVPIGSDAEADELTIGGYPAVELVDEGRREITVSLGEARAWQLIVEGDADELDEMLVSVKFDPDRAEKLMADELPSLTSEYRDRMKPHDDDGDSGKSDSDKSSPPVLEDGDAGPGGSEGTVGGEGGYENPATAATALAVEKYGMRESEPVLAQYKSDKNPEWTLVTFDMGGRQIAVWTREIGPVWKPITSSEEGMNAPTGFGVPGDLQMPYFG